MHPLTLVVLCVALAAASAGVVAPLAASVAVHDTPIVAPAIAAAPAVVAHHGLLGHGVIAARHGLLGAGVVANGVLGHGLIASPIKADGYPLLAAGSGIEGQYIHDLRGSGIDGQYVHDNTELLYDSGKYHGEIYA